MPNNSDSVDDWFELIDLSAVPYLDDKHRECEFFFDLLSVEEDRSRFRWLVSAFLNAVYSYFETSALTAYFRFTHPETREPIEDSESLEILRKYVRVFQNAKNPNFVKTSAVHPVVREVYELRKTSTHHYSLSIMEVGPELPRDFQLGDLRGKGEPALQQCKRAIGLVRAVQVELNS